MNLNIHFLPAWISLLYLLISYLCFFLFMVIYFLFLTIFYFCSFLFSAYILFMVISFSCSFHISAYSNLISSVSTAAHFYLIISVTLLFSLSILFSLETASTPPFIPYFRVFSSYTFFFLFSAFIRTQLVKGGSSPSLYIFSCSRYVRNYNPKSAGFNQESLYDTFFF